jgi:hypothetical protein
MSNPLDLEPMLLARLQTALAGLVPAVHVLTAAELADVAEERQLVPAVHLLFGDLKPLEAVGADTRVACTWLTVVAVRNVAAQRKGATQRANSAVLLQAVYAALAGWKPTGQSKPLELAPSAAGGHSNGFFYLPLTWRTELVWRATAPTI